MTEAWMTLKYLSVSELLTLLPLGKTTVYGLLASGDIPNSRVGGRILVAEADLVAYLDSRKRVKKTIEVAEKATGPSSPPARKRARKASRPLPVNYFV